MHTVLYRSRARAGLLASDLNAIIATAEARNASLGVTGLLLYGDLPAVAGAPGEFVQWLEGSEQPVEALFERIASDRRHFDVETLARGPIAEIARRSGVVRPDGRLFGRWAMGLVRLSQLPATLPGFLGFARDWDRTTLPHAA